MRRARCQDPALWPSARRFHGASPSLAQMKGEDEPEPVKAAQVPDGFLVKPFLEFQGGDGKLAGVGAFGNRALVRRVDAAGIGGS